jgi:hypothetical protein
MGEQTHPTIPNSTHYNFVELDNNALTLKINEAK